MKVKFESPNCVPVEKINCGDTFLTPRGEKHRNEMGLYMRVDANNGVLTQRKPYHTLAVNVQTGQLRWVADGTMVEPKNCFVQFAE